MSTTSVDLNIDLAPIVEPFFSQMGLSVDSLVVTSSYDEYSNVNVLNISSGALNFGSYQIVPSMNIVAIFDVNNTLIEISGLNDITNNSFGIVTEQALADSIETMYQSLVGDTSATVTDTFNVVDIVTSVIQPFLDNINTIEGYSVVSDTGGELTTLVYNVVINGPNTTQLSINFGANGAEYYANADGSLDAPIGVLIPLIDSTGFSQISGSLTFSLANGLNATGYAQTNEGDIFEGVIVTNIDGSTTFSGSFSGELSVGNILNQVFGDTFSNNEIILSSQGEFQIYDLAGSAVGLYSLTNNIPTTSLNIDLSNPLVAFPDPTLLGIIQQVNPEYLITLLGVGYAEGSFTTASGHTVTGSINNMGDYEITIDNVVIMSSSDANNAYIPEGFIPPADDAIVTQALETYVNQATGQIYTVPTGGWTIPENWLRDDSTIQNSETWIDYNGIIWTEESTDRLNTIHIVSSQGDDFFIIDNTDTTIDSFTIDGTVVINGIAFTNWHSVDLIDILTGETVAYDGTAAAPSGIELSFSMVLDSQRFEEMYGVIELPFVNFIDNNGNPYEVILATGSSGTYTDVNRIIWTDTYTDYADGRIVDYSVNENGGWTQEVEVPNSDGSVDFYETDSHGSNIHFNEVSIDGLEYATGVGSYYAGNLGIVTDIQVEIIYNDSTGERSFSGTAITPGGSPIIISGVNEPLLTVTSADGTTSVYDLDGKVLTFDSYIDDNGITWMITKTLNDDGSAYEYHTNEVNNKTKETAFDVDGVLASYTYNDYSDSSDYESHYDYINDTHVTTDRMLDEDGNISTTIIRTREESLELDVSPVHYLKQRLDAEGNVYRTTTEARDANGYIETLENGEIYKQQVITYGDNGIKIKTDDYYDNGTLERHVVWSYDANGNRITLEYISQHLHSADSEDYLTAPNEPAHMHYRVKEFDSSGNLIRESGRKEFENNLVQIRNIEYNADGLSTMTGAKYRSDGTIYETISEDINGIRSSTVYEADGTTVKWMMEKTPASEGINVTKTYKDANGEVYRTTTIITEEGIDKDGNPVTIYSEIDDATGLVRIHNDNSNENYWGVVHQTHQHKWYIENDKKMFITEEYDASGNLIDVTYTNNFGYVDHGTDDNGPVVQLIQIRNAETITKAQASIDEYGTDYTDGDTGKLMKFELWLDATELSSFATTNPVTEIRGYQFDINWNDLEVGALNFPTIAGTNIGFNAANPSNAAITFNSTTGNVAMASSTAIVDTDVSNDGPPSFLGAEVLIGTFYINPNADLETISLSINDMLIVPDDTDNIYPADYTSVLEISSVDATIQTDATNYLDNLSLNYFKDGVDTGVFTLVEGGDISFPAASLDFDSVKLSDPAAHTSGIAADDAVDILRDIVFLDIIETESATWHAADVNNDGIIAADDAVAVLRHIVFLDEIDTFDLIDNTTGNRVTNLDANAIDVGQWSVVANGDVDQSGEFGDAYVVQVDVI